MDPWSLYLLMLVCLSSLTPSIAQDGRCTKKVSRVVFYTETFTQSTTEAYYVKCGLFNLFKCTRYRTVYSVGSRRPSRIEYVSEYECCPGWITKGTNCLPTQPPTTEAVTTTARPTTTEIPTPATTTTTSPSTTSRSTSSRNNNNGDTQRHSRTRTSTTASPGNQIETSPVYVGGQGKSASLLSNRTMMMGISVVAVVVFLAMSIGVAVCGVRKFCPKKKPVGRMENESPTRRNSEGIQMNGTVPNGGVGHGARPKLKQKVKGHKGKLTATSNPGYDIMDLDDSKQENSYEAIASEEGPLKPHKLQKDAKGFECVRMSDLMPSPAAIRPQTSPVKGRRPSAPVAVTENEYTAFADELRTSPEPSKKKTISKDNNNHQMGESMIGQRKPLPKPKPLPKIRRNLQPVEGSPNTCAPPSAANHLVAPPAATAQYLDMSKGQTSPPTNADRRSCEREGASPRKPFKKFPSLEESSKSSIEDCTLEFRSNLSGPSSGNANLYDHVGETRSEPSSRRGSDAKHAFPTQGMYVLPGDLSPATTKKLHSVADEKMTCTYVLGDDVPGLAPRSPLFSDSYGLVDINGCSNHDIARDSANELRNLYDVVVTPENRRKMPKPVIAKSSYATPRQDSMDQDSNYENHRRSTASLPNNSRKLSLAVQSYEDEEVYDTVEVKDSHSMTTGRPPKVAPKKPVVTSGQESQKAKTAIERSRSGPSLLRYAELDSVYVNTSRF